MKAIVCTKYGPPEVLCLQEVDKPAAKADELLLKIFATTVSAADYRIRGFNVPFGFGILMRLVIGLRKPRNDILGMDYAGEVETVGSNVSCFKVGDRVFGIKGDSMGAYAEFLCVQQESTVALIPRNLSYEQAAAIPFGALTALLFLRDKGKIRSGQNIMIYGASGSVGTAAVQIAKSFNAKVTAVCSSANIELVKSLGADKVIDYSKEDFTKTSERYDIVMDTVGKTSFSCCKHMLVKKGRYLFVYGGMLQMLLMLWTSIIGRKKVIGGNTSSCAQDLFFLRELIVTGKLQAVIDTLYSMEGIVDAHHYADKGHKKGNVVILIREDNS